MQFTRILDQCHELHIRWASERGYSARAPFSSRVSVGLNVFVTPSGTGGAGRERRVTGGLCRLLREVFGVDSDSNSGSEEERCLVPEVCIINSSPFWVLISFVLTIQDLLYNPTNPLRGIRFRADIPIPYPSSVAGSSCDVYSRECLR